MGLCDEAIGYFFLRHHYDGFDVFMLLEQVQQDVRRDVVGNVSDDLYPSRPRRGNGTKQLRNACAQKIGLDNAYILSAGKFLLQLARKLVVQLCCNRSEERRVGKECRSWWSPYH